MMGNKANTLSEPCTKPPLRKPARCANKANKVPNKVVPMATVLAIHNVFQATPQLS